MNQINEYLKNHSPNLSPVMTTKSDQVGMKIFCLIFAIQQMVDDGVATNAQTYAEENHQRFIYAGV